jgi:hypothetical protein
VLLPLEWKRRQDKGYQNCNAARHPLSQEHEARRRFCPSLKSGGIAHSTGAGLKLIVSTRTANPIIIPYVFIHNINKPIYEYS